MKTIIICVIVVFYIVLKKTEAIVEVVKKAPSKDPVFYFPNTFWGRTAAAKLRRTHGFKFVTIILGFDHGMGVKLEHNMPICLMSVIDPDVAIILVPNLSDDFHDRIDEVEAMISEWTTNHTYVTVPDDQLADATAKKNAYKAARGTNRKGKFSKLMEVINAVMFLYQTACNLDRDNCFEIAASGKFHIREKGGSVAQEWALENSVVPGEILLTAVTTTNPAHTYNWWYSADGITWVAMRGTFYAHTKKSDLTPNTWAYFKYELSENDVLEFVSPPLRINVKG